MGPRNQEVMLDFSGQLVDPDFTSSGKEEEARAGNDHKRWFQSAVWGFEEKRCLTKKAPKLQRRASCWLLRCLQAVLVRMCDFGLELIESTIWAWIAPHRVHIGNRQTRTSYQHKLQFCESWLNATFHFESFPFYLSQSYQYHPRGLPWAMSHEPSSIIHQKPKIPNGANN